MLDLVIILSNIIAKSVKKNYFVNKDISSMLLPIYKLNKKDETWI